MAVPTTHLQVDVDVPKLGIHYHFVSGQQKKSRTWNFHSFSLWLASTQTLVGSFLNLIFFLRKRNSNHDNRKKWEKLIAIHLKWQTHSYSMHTHNGHGSISYILFTFKLMLGLNLDKRVHGTYRPLTMIQWWSLIYTGTSCVPIKTHSNQPNTHTRLLSLPLSRSRTLKDILDANECWTLAMAFRDLNW